MSERILAIIWIGGQLEESRADILINAIRNKSLFANEGDVYFQPSSAFDLIESLNPTGHLYLCDDNTASGDMPKIKQACLELGLSYRIWHEALTDVGSEIELWNPLMEKPVVITGDHKESESYRFIGHDVDGALTLIEQSKDGEAMELLNHISPNMPPLPRFELLRSETDGKSTFDSSETRLGSSE